MEISIEELREMQKDRDKVVARIAQLEASPEPGTFNDLARKVVSNSVSFTPDQREQIKNLIINRGAKPTD